MLEQVFCEVRHSDDCNERADHGERLVGKQLTISIAVVGVFDNSRRANDPFAAQDA